MRSTKSTPSTRSTKSTLSTLSTLSTYAEIAANATLVLIAVACSLLDRQLAAQAKKFEEEGGFTERLHRTRTRCRGAKPNSQESQFDVDGKRREAAYITASIPGRP